MENTNKFLNLDGLKKYHNFILNKINNAITKLLAKNIHIVEEGAQDLKADGGPWASVFSEAGLGTINHSTTLYDIFNKLLRKELHN